MGIQVHQALTPRVGIPTLMWEHYWRLRASRRCQVMFYFPPQSTEPEPGFHRMRLNSARAERWMRLWPARVMGTYNQSVTLDELLEDAQAMLEERLGRAA